MDKDAKKFIEKAINIEKDFFELDEETNVANVKIEFNSPEEIFDINYITKTPVFSDDFIDRIYSCCELIPNKYKINLKICFDDMSHYTVDELIDIFHKNAFLEIKRNKRLKRGRSLIGYSLIGLGIISLVIMLLINFLSTNMNGVLKEILGYVLDTITCVLIWEGFYLVFIENKERRMRNKQLIKRFKKISFEKLDILEKEKIESGY